MAPEGRAGQAACKPGSVPAVAGGGWPFIWDARYRTPHATYPGGDAKTRLPLRPRRAAPTRSCSRWGLPCRARRRARGALLPHPFTLARLRRGFGGRFAFCGTFPGVAPAGCYPAPCFRGARTFLPPRLGRCRPERKAAIRPSGPHLLGRPPAAPRQPACASRASSSVAVSASGRPLTSCGRKWRWKAARAVSVVASRMPLGAATS